MPWFNVDDGLTFHPKVLAAGNAALGAWTRMGAYCARYATEGFVPGEVARSIGSRSELTRLVGTGWLHPEGDGFRMHDYLDYNRDAEQIQRERDRAAERKRRQRERQRHRDSHGVTDGVTDGVSHKPQAKPSQAKPTELHLSPELAAATPCPPAAAAALELYVTHRLRAEGPNVRSTSVYAQSIRQREAIDHAAELASVAPDADPIDIAVQVFGLTRDQAIAAHVHNQEHP